MKSTTRSLRALKGVRPIVCLTAYDVSTARIADAGGADLILVGDSLGNTVLGLPDTVGVTLDMMIHHASAVVRAKTDAIVVGDLPFGLAHDSFPKLLGYCRRFLQEAGVKAVKIEGGASLAPSIARLVDAGIPVMGHIGLTPQSIHQFGSYKARGQDDAERLRILDDARSLDQAGAFAIVVEKVPATLGKEISATVQAPVIGIGAGPDCDGQVLVTHDMLGMFSRFRPRFVRRYAELGTLIQSAVQSYAQDVRNGGFPGPDESY